MSKKKFESLIWLIGAVFFGYYMLLHQKHDSKLYLGNRLVLFKAFCLEGGLCEGGSFVIFLSFGL